MNDIMKLSDSIAEMVFPPKQDGDTTIIDMRKIELQKMLMAFAMEINGRLLSHDR